MIYPLYLVLNVCNVYIYVWKNIKRTIDTENYRFAPYLSCVLIYEVIAIEFSPTVPLPAFFTLKKS